MDGRLATGEPSECPLVYDDKVIYTPAGDQTTMVALNKDTGN